MHEKIKTSSIQSNPNTPPNPDELEISIFGPGYGEALAIHLGQNSWLLVDSCYSRDSRTPVSIDYLNSIGADLSTDVELVVVTHWHDDHVRGIATIVERCTSARVVISDALRTDEFLTLANLFGYASIPDGSGVDELASLFQIVNARRPGGARFGSPLYAGMDRLLYDKMLRVGSANIQTKVFSLSPSDESKLHSQLAFSKLIPPAGHAPPPIASPSENHASVALIVEVPPDRFLLGGDLEATDDPTRGWAAILESSNSVLPPAQAFKIPHHGSISSHDDRIWTSLLIPNPYAILTPFLRGVRMLPTQEDIIRIRASSSNAYATSLASVRRYRSRERVVNDMVSGATRSIQDLRVGFGHVRLRKTIGPPPGDWQVELFGDAVPL